MKAVIRAGELARGTGTAAEDLLGPRAMDRRRPRIAVDEHHVVALAVPAAGDVVDLEEQPHHLPRTRRLERDVVLHAVEVLAAVELDVRARPDRRRRPLLPPLRMEAERVAGERTLVGLVIDVVPERRQRAAERAIAT